MYDLYDVKVTIINPRMVGKVEPDPSPDPSGACEFVPDGSTNALLTADGAIFCCRMEGQ